MSQTPPLALVKTWCDLLQQQEDLEARQRAAEMLIGAFGSMDAVAKFLKQQDSCRRVLNSHTE